MRRWAPAIGTHVTYVAVPGARHDVVLSRPEVRARVYEELERWVTAYVDDGARARRDSLL
jgi:alpha-beta hydrolase superfamily lysophospholipase